MSLVVPDHRRDEFDTLEGVEEREYGVATPAESHMLDAVRRRLPRARVIPITDLSDYFEGRVEGADALVMIAEKGSAWTLRHPEFHVATPWKEKPKIPLVYLIAGQDREFRAFLDDWIRVKRLRGITDGLYSHWILGRAAERRGPRWSIARDVLGWIE